MTLMLLFPIAECRPRVRLCVAPMIPHKLCFFVIAVDEKLLMENALDPWSALDDCNVSADAVFKRKMRVKV